MQKALGYKHIVTAVAVQVTAHPAMRRAINIAEKTQGGVTLVHAIKDPTKSKSGDVSNGATPEQIKAHLQQLESSQPLVHGIRLITGRKWEAINQIADESEADLIVIGSFVHGRLRAFLGETSNRIVRAANRDVLVVRSDLYSEESPPKDYKTIVMATDLGDSGPTVVEKANQMAKAFGARLILLHAIDHFPQNRENEDITPENMDPKEYQRQLKARKLGNLAEQIGQPDIPQEVIVSTKSTKQIVADYARDQGADLIIIGSRKSFGADLLLGPTADGIVGSAPCDVLVSHT